ncbi:E3 ubiquitin-protein ligase NHLRC1 [Rhinophrynus dorsalis]
MSSLASKEIRSMRDFLDETEINLLECKVCFEKYNHQERHRPRNLPCGHVICHQCVSSLCLQGNTRLECPFCRKVCRILETSVCLPVLHLMEIIGRIPDQLLSECAENTSSQVTRLRSAHFKMSLSFGGWGILFNPTGIALCKKTGCLVVAHDGKKRICIFRMNGKCIRQIGMKCDSPNTILYPIDVAVTRDGYIFVTDAGDHSLKVFNWTGTSMFAIKQTFSLPWGLDVNPQNEVIVSDPEAGNLFLVAVDYQHGKVKNCLKICSNLSHPREIAVCQTSGAVIVVEHLAQNSKNSSRTRVKILDSTMKIIRQIDSFGLSLFLPLAVHTTGVAFDQEGNILVVDVNNRCVICLDKMGEFNSLKYVVASGLSYPVALSTLSDGSIAVLDSGNNSVLVYTP